MQMAQKILIIEDEDGIIHLLNLYLRNAGYDVVVAKDGADGLALHARTHPDLVILDIMLLVSRVRAILRRVGDTETGESRAANIQSSTAKSILRFPSLTIDLLARRVEVDSSEVTLTPTEFDLLALLAQSPERVFTREILMNKIWGYDYYGDGHIIDVHISALRKKIEANADYRYIKTVWRVGYKFEVGARTAVS